MAEDESITIRLPTGLKEAVLAAADTRGMTLTGFVRQALQNELAPNPQAHQLPGFSPDFSGFLERLEKEEFRPEVLLLVVEPGGNRLMFRGYVDGNLTNESMVAVAIHDRGNPWMLLRRDVVAWFGIERVALIPKLVRHFKQQGWFPVTYAPR